MSSSTEEKSSYTLKIRPQEKLWHLDFMVDLYIHEPEVQDFLEAKSIQTLHIEGRHDPYARNLRLGADGFIGLESSI